MSLKLLYTRRSPYARKARVIALEKGITLELIDEDLVKKSARLLEANPLGKVPTLILQDGSTVYDSPLICQYLDGLNTKNPMIPQGAYARLKVLKWEAFADDLVTNAINLYMERVRHPKDFHQDFVTAQENNIRGAYRYIEAHLDELTEFDLASVAVASAIGYIHFRLAHLKAEGSLLEWFERIQQRPSMQQTIPVV